MGLGTSRTHCNSGIEKNSIEHFASIKSYSSLGTIICIHWGFSRGSLLNMLAGSEAGESIMAVCAQETEDPAVVKP